jgi:hypothetical protein
VENSEQNTLENSPFDLSVEIVRSEYDEIIRSSDNLNTVISWYLKNYQSFHEAGIKDDQIKGNILAASGVFPGRLKADGVYSRISIDITQQLVDIVNFDPQILYKVPHVPEAVSPMDRLLAVRPDLDIARRLFGEERKNMIEKQQKIRSENAHTADEMAKVLKMDKLTYDQASYISTYLESVKRVLDNSIYHYLVARKAVAIISGITPNVSGLAKDEFDKTLVATSSVLVNGEPDNITWVSLVGVNILTMFDTSDLKSQDFYRGYQSRVLDAVHEFSHGITTTLLFGDGPLRITDTEGWVEASLHSVIGEGVAIAYEYETLKRVNMHTKDKRQLEEINTFGKNRVVRLREVNRDASETKAKNRSRPLQTYKTVVYPEGSRLALALRGNGWDLNDLPQITSAIKEVVKDSQGRDDISTFRSIGVDRNVASQYMKIIDQIRHIEKESKP